MKGGMENERKGLFLTFLPFLSLFIFIFILLIFPFEEETGEQ